MESLVKCYQEKPSWVCSVGTMWGRWTMAPVEGGCPYVEELSSFVRRSGGSVHLALPVETFITEILTPEIRLLQELVWLLGTSTTHSSALSQPPLVHLRNIYIPNLLDGVTSIINLRRHQGTINLASNYNSLSRIPTPSPPKRNTFTTQGHNNSSTTD